MVSSHTVSGTGYQDFLVLVMNCNIDNFLEGGLGVNCLTINAFQDINFLKIFSDF